MLRKRDRKPRKRAYVLVCNGPKDESTREVLFLEKEPVKEDFREDGTVMYTIGPFRTNGAAELFKANPGKFETVSGAEKEYAKRYSLIGEKVK